MHRSFTSVVRVSVCLLAAAMATAPGCTRSQQAADVSIGRVRIVPAIDGMPSVIPVVAGLGACDPFYLAVVDPAWKGSPEPSTQVIVSGEAAEEVRLVAGGTGFTPGELHATPGRRMRVTMINAGAGARGVEFDLPDGAVSRSEFAAPGGAQVVEVIAPTQPGTYVYRVAGGEGEAMQGRLIVRNAPRETPTIAERSERIADRVNEDF